MLVMSVVSPPIGAVRAQEMRSKASATVASMPLLARRLIHCEVPQTERSSRPAMACAHSVEVTYESSKIMTRTRAE